MSTVLDREGGGRRENNFFLSTHRCPEVDLLPHHNTETQSSLTSPPFPTEKSSEAACTGQSKTEYLDIPSTSNSEEEGAEEDEESISDWSEEDLSLHFSPSVILASGDEESDVESGFECVDISVETLVKGQEGLKMVPKRQIQLKKKDVENVINTEETGKLQIIMRDGPAEEGVANNGVSASELLCPTIRHRPDLLLRQHSMPASLQTCSATSSDVYSHRVYKGLVAGANQGFHLEGNSRQRLQKSLSLDETKTKMASSIIKNVLSKKMQVEQNNSKTSYLQKPEMLPSLPQPAHQQRWREGGGKKTGGGVLKVPVHAVRDMRSLVKNTYSLSFTNAPTTPENIQPRCIKVTGQEESPPPTYQQAVGVKENDETQKSCKASVCSSFSTGNTTKVAACLSQSQDKKPSNRFTQQRQYSEPILNRNKVDDVTWSLMLNLPTNSSIDSDLSEHSQSEKAAGVSHQAGTYQSPSVSIQPFPHAPSTSRQTKGTQPLLSAKDQSSSLDVSSQFAPSSSQQIFHSCFYPPTTLRASTPTLHPKVGKVSYMHRPLHYIQTQLPPFSPAHTLHLLRRSEANYSGSTIYTSNQLDWTCPPHRTRTAGDQESNGDTVTPGIQGQHELQKLQQQLQQQQFLCSIQGFLPAQVGSEFLVDVAGSAAANGALLTGPTSCHIMPNPKTGQCIHVNTLPQPQTKMLLDPETGQYVQVFLPAAGSAPNTNVFPVYFVNRDPFVSSHAPSAMNPTTSLLSVMQIQPMAPVSSLYAPPCLPSNPTHTIS